MAGGPGRQDPTKAPRDHSLDKLLLFGQAQEAIPLRLPTEAPTHVHSLGQAGGPINARENGLLVFPCQSQGQRGFNGAHEHPSVTRLSRPK